MTGALLVVCGCVCSHQLTAVSWPSFSQSAPASEVTCVFSGFTVRAAEGTWQVRKQKLFQFCQCLVNCAGPCRNFLGLLGKLTADD